VNTDSTRAKQAIAYRRWENVRKNKAHAEELIIQLMANPATEPEHLAQAHAMYADMCKRIHDVSHHIVNIIRTGSTTPVEFEDTTCLCGYTERRIKGTAYRCVNCGMY
jgi:exopolyphosphatase/pppGpp-phosphohydrolase